MESSVEHHHHDEEELHSDIIYPSAIPFILAHLACLAAVWTGVTLQAVLLGLALYVVRMFGVTAGFHRYFSHRSYKTSRAGQFVMALLCQTSAQRGVIWWASIHRQHHKHSDTELDVHSPRHHGFWYSHVGWIFDRKNHDYDRDYSNVQDLTRYPELVWLDRNPYLVAVLLGLGIWYFAGWGGLVVGFFWSTVLLYHGTFAINSLAHVHGKQRYLTGDDSRNNWWLALITLGEGWHNNHHAYQSSTRQGFRWWEVDATYYVLKALSWTRLVGGLRPPPEEVVRNEHRLGRKVVEKAAHRIAGSFQVDRLAEQVRSAWAAHSPHFQDVLERARTARGQAEARWAEMRLAEVHLPELPELPTMDDLRARTRDMLDHVPSVSVDEIGERAREILLVAVSRRLLDQRA